MRKEKQGYVLYKNWTPVLLNMSDEDLAKMFRAILLYQEGQPVTDAPPFFQSIRATFDQDQEKYNRRCEDNRINRMIGNLKGLREDVLLAQLEMMSIEDLQAIVEKAKDTDLKNAVILELHQRTQVTNVRHVTNVTCVTDVTEKDLDMEKGSDTEKDSENGLEMGFREEPHVHGCYQNIFLTDPEYFDLLDKKGQQAFESAVDEVSKDLRRNPKKSAGGYYQLILSQLQNYE